MNQVQMPYAVDAEGRLQCCTTAPREGAYSCPQCKKAVVLRRGEVLQPHFGHAADSTCPGEGLEHVLAKHLVRQVLIDSKRGIAGPPNLTTTCSVCGERSIKCAIPDLDDVVLEQSHETRREWLNEREEWLEEKGVRVLDVAIRKEGVTVAAIEVLSTHAVDSRKADDLLGLPWIELRASEVLINPSNWNPVQERWHRETYDDVCDRCNDRVQRFYGLRDRVSEMRNQPILNYYFRTAPHRCWKCDKAVLVYAWKYDYKSALHNARVEDDKAPRTIQFRYIATQKAKAWTNVCPCCDAVQGEFFLHMEPNGPFFGSAILEDDDDHGDYLRMAHVMETVGGRKFPPIE